MSKTTGIQWFVEPFGEYTNNSISAYLNQASLVNESSSVMGHTYRKNPINTFRIEREFALKLLESQKKDPALKFRIFHSRYGSRKVTLWKSSEIIHDEKKSKLKVVPELDDKIKQSEKEIAEYLFKLSNEFSCFRINRLTAKSLRYLENLDDISATLKSLGRQTRGLRKLLTPKLRKK